MELLDFLRGQERIAKTGQERVTERYSRIVIDLGTARTDEEIHITGDYLAVAKMDGTASTTYFKLNHINSRQIYPSEIEKLYATYKKIYLTNAADAGKELVLYVGGALSGEIKVSGAGKTGLIDASGTRIDPCKEDGALYDELVKHTTALQIIDDWDSANKCKVEEQFGGVVYSTPKTSTNAVAKFEAAAKLLRDVVIKNTDAANAVDIGLYHATPANFRAASFELGAGASIGFTMVDMNSLAVISSVDDNHAVIHVIGTAV